MYLLDTNIISELRKAKSGNAHPQVVDWAKRTPPASMFLSVITILELETGILMLARRDQAQGNILRNWMDTHVLPAFLGRILPVDIAVAQQCAQLHIPNPQAERDSLIAATALVHGMTVVTRNATDFTSTGVKLINPWQAADPTTI